jgi:D-sedoheptulose 7-phosphate isomerase
MTASADSGSIDAIVRASLDVHRLLAEDTELLTTAAAAAEAIGLALAGGRAVYFCGNGGSAADAQHLAAELTGRLRAERRGLPGLALTTDTSALTAIANDFDFADVFARQLTALARPGDVVVGISTSGGSENVCRALAAGRAAGVVCIAFTGADGGPLAAAADYALRVPSADTQRVQECHILLGHALLELAEARVMADGGGRGA